MAKAKGRRSRADEEGVDVRRTSEGEMQAGPLTRGVEVTLTLLAIVARADEKTEVIVVAVQEAREAMALGSARECFASPVPVDSGGRATGPVEWSRSCLKWLHFSCLS